MGIVRFIPWLLRRFRITYNNRIPATSLWIDMNGEIHQAAAKIYGNTEDEQFNKQRKATIERMDEKTRADFLEAQHIELVINQIFHHMNWAKPQYFVILAVDGVAPDAKINQQRQRRYRAATSNAYGGYFNSNSITPGTRFMRRLDKAIRDRIEEAISKGTILPPTIIYSSHMSPGEGEHKILDFLRDRDLKLVTRETNKGGNIFYGLDADLVMLSLLAPINNIFLYREQEGRMGTQMLRIDLLKSALKRHYLRTKNSVIKDFVLMSFLTGNDFLPHQPSLATIALGMDAMLEIYGKLGLSLTTDKGFINWRNFLKFLMSLSNKEPDMLVNEFGMLKKYPSPLLAASISSKDGKNVINMETFKYYWYYNMTVWQPEDLKYLKSIGVKLGKPSNDTNVSNIVLEYLKTISWNLQYYGKGFGEVNARWFYPHHHTPLLQDVVRVLASYIDNGDYIKRLDRDVLNDPATKPLNVVYQLLAVMPTSSADLVPREARPLMAPTSIIGDMFPTQFVVERYGVDEDWMGEVMIPFFNADRIRKAVDDTIQFSESTIELYKSTPAYRYVTRDVATGPKQVVAKKTRKTKPGMLSREERVSLWKHNKLPL